MDIAIAPRTAAPTMLVAEVAVAEVVRLSPAFVRVVLAGPALADVARPGFDARCKVIFPGLDGALLPLPADPEDWYENWLRQPEPGRSPIRTYTIRDVVGEGSETRVVIDMVVHDDDVDDVDAAGPACRWARGAAVGDRVQLVLPHRAAATYAGVEFEPLHRRRLLLVGDETAVPAIARILADLPAAFVGRAYLEVPTRDDVLEVAAPDGVDLVWIVRDRAPHGHRTVQRVRTDLGLPPASAAETHETHETHEAPEAPELLWETPTFSASGALESEPGARSDAPDELYAWIAGESRMVTTLRRALVAELDVPRSQVAFMGYWRKGVAMRA